MEKKNILFLLGVYPNYGGTEKITTVLANEFSLLGFNVHICSFEQPIASDEKLDKSVQLHKLSYPVLSRKNFADLKRIVRDHHISILINQWSLPFYTNILCNIAIKNQKCALISVLHGIPHRSKKEIEAHDQYEKSKGLKKIQENLRLNVIKKIIRYSLKYTYKNSSKYVLLSNRYEAIFKKEASLYETEKLITIGNPITVAEPTGEIENIIRNKRKEILYVGRMDYENKRVNRIVEAWSDIAHLYQDWKLVLVGDGPHKSKLEKYVLDNSVGNVEFTGFVKDDPIEYYKNASIFVLTSDLEGFGLVLLEAMIYGVVPIVYGSYEAAYDIVDHDLNGFIIPIPYKKEDTISYLENLINDSEGRNKKAFSAYNKAKNFSLLSIVNQWQNLFYEVK